jgi:peptidyl-prolyl cis-trans isomerase A (cyclophilin A)
MSLFRSQPEGPDTPAPPLNVPGEGELRATFHTSLGDVTVRLFEKEAPRTVANFVALALGQVEWTKPDGSHTTGPLYTNTVFHRVIPEFMIQGGDPTGTGRGGPGWRFRDECRRELRHDKPGRLSMANAGENTNGSQFFLTEVPTPWLDGKHTIFGEVIENLPLVAKIARAGDGKVSLASVSVFRA